MVCEENFADHVLLFMIHGVAMLWKQVVGYTVSASSMNTFQLRSFLLIFIKEYISAELIAVATICDQSGINVSCIESLIEETSNIPGIFIVDGHEIIPVYDPSHLLTGI